MGKFHGHVTKVVKTVVYQIRLPFVGNRLSSSLPLWRHNTRPCTGPRPML